MSDEPGHYRGGRRQYDPLIVEAIDKHNDDEYAHGKARNPLEVRMGNLEKWQQRVLGFCAAIAFVVTGLGAVALLK